MHSTAPNNTSASAYLASGTVADTAPVSITLDKSQRARNAANQRYGKAKKEQQSAEELKSAGAVSHDPSRSQAEGKY